MPHDDLDAIRRSVLSRIERGDRLVRITMLGAALLEAAMLAVVLLIIDWKDRTQVLVFVTAMLGYTIIVLGLAALGAHVSRSVGRILAALEPRDLR
jgi:hypothetical protein